jgi:hypothetical protein
MGGLFGILIPCRDSIFPPPINIIIAASEIALAYPLSALTNEALAIRCMLTHFIHLLISDHEHNLMKRWLFTIIMRTLVLPTCDGSLANLSLCIVARKPFKKGSLEIKHNSLLDVVIQMTHFHLYLSL